MRILEHIALSDYTTMRVGGEARFFVSVKTERELEEAVAFAEEKNIPFFVLGGGSNTVVGDKGFDGLVIKNSLKRKSNAEDSWFHVFTRGAGESWDMFVKEVADKGIFALENLSFIPGTVGGAPVQNIGAYGVEVKEYIQSVRVYDTDLKQYKDLTREECAFSYRESVFKRQKNLIIVSVVFKLPKRGRAKITYKDVQEEIVQRKLDSSTLSPSDVRDIIIDIRKRKLPDWTETPTAGSFFKNPEIPLHEFERLKKRYLDLPGHTLGSKVKVSLAWIIEHVCGMKGFKVGGARVYQKHALIIVCEKKGTAEDVFELSRKIEDAVYRKTGIRIEREVLFIA